MSRRKTSSEGILFVVSSPSGAGKTTVVKEVLRREPNLRKTVSHTTRTPRPGERNGRDYFFVPEAAFRQMVSRRGFVEWIRNYGYSYGTSKATIRKILASGRDAVLVIESRGARAIRRQFRDAVFVSIVAPSFKVLRRRIVKRAAMSDRELNTRLRLARKEMAAMAWYDYLIVNDRLGDAVADLRAILAAERARLERRNVMFRKILARR